PQAAAWRTRRPGARLTRAEPTVLRAGAASFDLEREAALGHVGVDGQHAPEHLVRARRQRGQRRAQHGGIRTIDVRVTPIHLLAALVDDADRAVRRLEAPGGIELPLLRPALESDLAAPPRARAHRARPRAAPPP